MVRSGHPKDLSAVLRELARFLEALGPYLQRGVLTGGLVPMLYRSCQWASKPRHSVLPTFDIDWTFPSHLSIENGQILRRRCENAGFVILKSSTTEPPVQVLQNVNYGVERRGPIYIELLTPLRGAAVDRQGRSRSPVEIQKGLTAQALRYLDLLLEEPIRFETQRFSGLEGLSSSELYLPHPLAYLLQKALALRDRTPASQKKDLAYIVDVILVTRHLWPEMRKRLDEQRSNLPTKWLNRAKMTLEDSFATSISKGPVAARSIFANDGGGHSPLAEETISRVVLKFVREIWN